VLVPLLLLPSPGKAMQAVRLLLLLLLLTEGNWCYRSCWLLLLLLLCVSSIRACFSCCIWVHSPPAGV